MVLKDESFSLKMEPAMAARKTAVQLLAWIPGHQKEVSQFENKLVKSLCTCMQSRAKSQKISREKIWTAYHGLRISVAYRSEWQTFLESSISISKVSPIFCQFVGDFVFKALIRLHHPIAESTENNSFQRLTYEETNALRYAAGYIPPSSEEEALKINTSIEGGYSTVHSGFTE